MVQLLAFKQQWSSQVQSASIIPPDVSKWIFTICIILSAVNLIYEHIRANRAMRTGSVAESFLDHLAAKLESLRIFGGKGWKRFLVFAALTESKKGVEYIALFCYFNFQCKSPLPHFPPLLPLAQVILTNVVISMDPCSSMFWTSPGCERIQSILLLHQ